MNALILDIILSEATFIRLYYTNIRIKWDTLAY